MEAASERRRKMRSQAERVYQKYGARVHELICQLTGPTQQDHDRAFDRLARMGEFAAPALIEALADPALEPFVADEVISLLGNTGDEHAREPVWQFLQAHRDDPERASTAALSLAGLGDERALPYLREELNSDDEEIISNAVVGLIMTGELADISCLREVHRRHRANREIRSGIANVVLTILGETDRHTFNRALDEIRTSFADRALWADIWTILDSEFGGKRHTVH
jgi:HEAT repeat protein